MDLYGLIGLSVDDAVEHIKAKLSISAADGEMKEYPDCAYLQIHREGLSLVLNAKQPKSWMVESVDIYSSAAPECTSKSRRPPTFTPFTTAFVLPASGLAIKPGQTGAELVTLLGEPARKGGGVAGSSGGIWCEWPEKGLMVRLASSGLGAWDKGGTAPWTVATIFQPSPPKP